jgi:hypothetical protein
LPVARVVNGDWISRKHEEIWQSIHGQKQAKGFLKKQSARKAGELLNLSTNQLKIMTVADRTLLFKRTPI